MKITEDIKYVGVNDHQVDLFEGQYIVPNGISYNSYLIKDEKNVVTKFMKSVLNLDYNVCKKSVL